MKIKKTKILTKQFKYEDYILVLVGVIALVLGVLIYAKVINPEAYSDNTFSILIILMGIISIIVGISGIIKKRKYKNSVFFELVRDFNNNLIETKLKNYGINYEEIKIVCEKDSVGISVETKSGEFTLACFKNILIYSFDTADENNADDLTINILEEYDALKITIDETYLKFVHLANQYKK